MSNGIDINIPAKPTISMQIGEAHVSANYTALTHKPKINSVELVGDKSASDLNLQSKMDALTTQEIEQILYTD